MEEYLNLFGISENSTVIKCSEEDMMKIEAASFIYNGLKTLIRQFTSGTDLKPSEEIINEIFEDYEKAYFEYDTTYRTVVLKYISEEDYQTKHVSANFELCSFIIN